jgi:hypothetical protein
MLCKGFDRRCSFEKRNSGRESREAKRQGELINLLPSAARSRYAFGNPEEGERPPFESVTKQRLLKTEKTYVCCSCSDLQSNSVRLLYLFMLTFCKCSINSITNPKVR